jgi:hypothetical protein
MSSISMNLLASGNRETEETREGAATPSVRLNSQGIIVVKGRLTSHGVPCKAIVC